MRSITKRLFFLGKQRRCRPPQAAASVRLLGCRLAAGCLCLCTVAHLLQKLVSKLMAIHFHQSTHFERLQNALKQVGGGWCCHMLPCREGPHGFCTLAACLVQVHKLRQLQ